MPEVTNHNRGLSGGRDADRNKPKTPATRGIPPCQQPPCRSQPTLKVRSFGHLAQDIAYLRRGCGLVVAPFKEGFRIGTDVVDADGMRARADRERKRRNHTVAATAVSAPSIPVGPPKPVIPPACGCGRIASHQGRCWVRRGWKGPTPT